MEITTNSVFLGYYWQRDYIRSPQRVMYVGTYQTTTRDTEIAKEVTYNGVSWTFSTTKILSS